MDKGRTYYFIALLSVLVLHSATNFFTFDQTYDAYVHIFFADHYAENWFENWDYRWYTGFTITSYPPLVHQIVALLSFGLGLKMAFFFWSVLAVLWLVRGMYNFAQLWVSNEAAGLAAILLVFTGSLTEAMHIFGQIPSITGMAFLLNACPEIYKWIVTKNKTSLYLAIAFLAVTSAAHHVTTIFGMVFFIFPTIGLAMVDLCVRDKGNLESVSIKDFAIKVLHNLRRLIPFGLAVGVIVILIIFPYWVWTSSDPITQVSIPHGSRDSFIEQPNLGVVFFIFPWGMMLFALPYIIARSYYRRHIFMGLSLTLLFILGTGGTTPLPRWILGDTAYDILTLDRFTFWATMISVPFFGEFMLKLYTGELKKFKYKPIFRKFTFFFFAIGIIGFNVLIVNAGYFQAFQPKEVDPDPILNFLNRDRHSDWRFMTLGFGDQMAWLSANTDALTVDGNYHSARRLPEMTSRAVERLENAKYQGQEGISSLKEFLTVPEKFNLKFIFANDKFYEPLLFFLGWDKISRLENNIVVWERPDVPPLPDLLPRSNIPAFQRFMWGTLPLLAFFIAVFLYLKELFRKNWKITYIPLSNIFNSAKSEIKSKSVWLTQSAWMIFLVLLSVGFISFVAINHDTHSSPERVINAYFDAINYKKFEKSYEYLDENSKPSLDQYLLELSLEDGILASYSILDSIKILDVIFESPTEAKAKLGLLTTTSLMNYTITENLFLVKNKGGWYIRHNTIEKDVPPDQFFGIPDVAFYKQGSRKADVSNTRREDVLDRPEAYIAQANLVIKDSTYYIVGEIQNLDNVPAYVTVEGTLLDENNNLIARYNAGNAIVRRLLPNEKTPFRIDFENDINSRVENNYYLESNIGYSNKVYKEPANFNVLVRTMVSGQSMYKFAGIKHLSIRGNVVDGSLINYGTREISIPQIMLAEYDQKGNIKWLETKYLRSGLRPQRKKDFTIKSKIDEVYLVEVGKDFNLFVNGTSKGQLNYFDNLEDHISENKSHRLNKIDKSSLKTYLNCFVYDLK